MNKTEKRASEARSEIVAHLPRACMNETAAVEFLEKQRWGQTPGCPHCGSVAVVKLLDDATKLRNKRFLWYCRDCHHQFTVRVGTVFEDSRIALRHWCYAFWAACASKKGVSAKQIKRTCQISYKSALFLMHRIRFAMAAPEGVRKLRGTIEVDETYVGGKPRIRGISKHGRGTKKTPVMAMVARKGNIRPRVIPDVSAATLKAAIREEVAKSSCIMTDEWASYQGIGKDFRGGHRVVRHARGEYVRGNTNTNTAESFFALLKRGIHGTFHNVSRKHLHRYLAEFAFRWNTRKIDDGRRVVAAIRSAEGKRLMYRDPCGRVA